MSVYKGFAALDFGSHRLKLALAEQDEEGRIHLSGLWTKKTAGIKRGAVINMEACVNALEELVSEAEVASGETIKAFHVAYSGENIEAVNSQGVAAIGLRGRGREITETDKENVIAAAQAIVIPEDKEIAHIIPLQYVVDKQELVKEPLHMIGVRLEAEAHIITAPYSLLSNIGLAVQRAGCTVSDLVYAPLATAAAVLNRDEKTAGAVILEIGSSTVKIAFYQFGEPYFNSVLPIGADSLTGDLAHPAVLNIPHEIAEQIKLEHGCCFKPLLDRQLDVFIPGGPDRKPQVVSDHFICDILSARMADIYNVARNELAKKGWLERARSIVIAGGGSQLPGAAELAGRIFNMPSRAAYTTGLESLDNESRNGRFGAVLGLLKQQRLPFKDEAAPVLLAEGKHDKKAGFIEWLRDFF